MAAVQKQLDNSGISKCQKAHGKLDSVATELDLSLADQSAIAFFLMFSMKGNRHLDMFLGCPPGRLGIHVQMLLKAAQREDLKWSSSRLKQWEQQEYSDGEEEQ